MSIEKIEMLPFVWYDLKLLEERSEQDFQAQFYMGWSPEWVDPDFNELGIRECFKNGEGTWTSSKWSNDQDTWWAREEGAPKKIMILKAPSL